MKAIYSGNLPKAFPDSSQNGGDKQQKCEIYLQYIDYHYTNVSYLPNNKIPEQIVLGSQYVNDRYSEIINTHKETDTKKFKNILWDIKEEREDRDINDTFESLSQELFHEHKREANDDIVLLSELLMCIFEKSQVALRDLAGTKIS